jgi:hypothetical protein
MVIYSREADQGAANCIGGWAGYILSLSLTNVRQKRVVFDRLRAGNFEERATDNQEYGCEEEQCEVQWESHRPSVCSCHHPKNACAKVFGGVRRIHTWTH